MNTYRIFFFSVTTMATLQISCGGDAPQKQQPLSFTESVVVGGLVGAAEVMLPGQALYYVANMAVQNKVISRNPADWYKGVFPNAVGVAPIAAIQKATNTQATEAITTMQEHDLSAGQRLAVAFGAGVTGAVVATPQEAISTYMGNNTTKTTRQAMSDLGTRAWRGFRPMAAREGVFSSGYQAVEPMMQDAAKSTMGNTTTAAVAGSVAAGVVTAVVSQPFAVVKTLVQSDPDKAQYKNNFDTVQKIYRQDGAKGFFRGGVARGTRVAIAIPLYAQYTKVLTQALQDK